MDLSELKELHCSKPISAMPLAQYLGLCKESPVHYANAHERMLTAIGEPEVVDTRGDQRLSRIFGNRTIKRYPTFNGFYGMEDVIERIVAYFKHGAQGLEERKQVLYLLGPVGGGKSSIVERVKSLMETQPIYALAVKREHEKQAASGPLFSVDGVVYEVSPVYESPLGLFSTAEAAAFLEKNYQIPRRRLVTIMSPWAMKRLQRDLGNDITRFHVLKLYPSQLRQIAITKVEPGDENTQDVSTLIGKVDIRKLDRYSQSDADAYAYAGGLNVTTQGVLEFVEMFKAPIKMLSPLLTSTQDGHYAGSENVGMMPYQGIVIAHSNEQEWLTFRNNKENEAYLDRIYIVKVPYCLQVTEEAQIYRKLIANSELAQAVCAPGTYEMLARFSVLTRLVEPENSNLYSKLRAYDGENLKDVDPKAKSPQEYRDQAGNGEGMSGISTRFAYKILSRTFNHDPHEVAANPVHLAYIIEQKVLQSDLPDPLVKLYLNFLKGYLIPRYGEDLGKMVQAAYIESFGDYAQNKFDRYVTYADLWIRDEDFRDPDTGESYDRRKLNEELEKIEKPAGVTNAKDFRTEIVHHVLRYRASHQGDNPPWDSYEKMKLAIEKTVFEKMEDLTPALSFGPKKDEETARKHKTLVTRLQEMGHTAQQVRILVEWHEARKKAK